MAVLICFLCFRRVKEDFIGITVVYYIFVCIAWAVASDSPIAAVATLLTLLAGPVLGLITFITHWRVARSTVAKYVPTHGFPILPVESDSGTEPD